MLRKVMFAMVAAGLLAACGESKSYAISASEVTSKLLATKPPMFVFGNAGVNVMVTQGEGGAVRWTILQQGRQVMRLVAAVTPDGENASRVAVSVEPPNNDASTAIGKTMADNPAIVNLYKSAMVEQIDARLTGRDFDSSKIQAQMVAAAMATMPKMQQSAMQAAQNSAAMERESHQRAVDEAYDRERSAAMSGYSNDESSSSSNY